MYEQLHRYYVSKDYSEFLGPKHKSFFSKHFLFSSVGPLHPGEKLCQGYIQKSFLEIGDYKKYGITPKSCFWRALSIVPPFFPPIQCLSEMSDGKIGSVICAFCASAVQGSIKITITNIYKVPRIICYSRCEITVKGIVL